MAELTLQLDPALLQKVNRWAESRGMSVNEAIAALIGQIPDSSSKPLEHRRAFLQLPIAERRRILAEQADAIAFHYEQDSEWRELQAGDIVEY
jgi:predicted component of type VI protein secretion system